MGNLFDKKGIEWYHVVIIVGIALAAGWYFFVGPGKMCDVDSDCPKGYVCSMDSKCIPMIVNENRIKDMICEDNTYPDGAYDPDCPMYCPSEKERKGEARMCCYTDDGLIAINCDTGKPVNLDKDVSFRVPSQRPGKNWYDMASPMAVISFVKTGAASNYKYYTNIRQILDITTSGAPKGATGYNIWLQSVTIKDAAGSPEPVMTAAWNECTISGGNPCIGNSGANLVGTNEYLPSAWTTGLKVADNIAVKDYTVVYEYCGKVQPETLGIAQECRTLIYDLSVGTSTLSFEVSAGIGS